MDLPHGPEAGGEARRNLRTALAERGLPEHVVDDVLIVAGELVVNAVDHGRPGVLGTIRMAWGFTSRHVVLRVVDAGTGPAFVEPEHEEASTRGRGLMMVDVICDDWAVDRGDSTVVTACIQR
ncbi:ATP-binding protein [Nocardioides sp. CPCC 205120]|uniref:ATP-binding protein n=1 Tax=Nocardioides sp. CPCC 205120 TaxID=3406462 RepID=UPI003B510FBC